MKKQLLIVVDMVNGFVHEGALADKKILRCVPTIKKEIEKAEKNKSKIVAFVDSHKKGCEEFLHFPEHCLEGSKESEIIPELQPYFKDACVVASDFGIVHFKDKIIIPKNETDGFSTVAMKTLAMEEFEEIRIVGCCTDICVENLVNSYFKFAKSRNIKVNITIPKEGVYTFDGENHPAAKTNMEALQRMRKKGVKIESTLPFLVNVEKINNGKFLKIYNFTFALAKGQKVYEVASRNNLEDLVVFQENPKPNAVRAVAYMQKKDDIYVVLNKEFRFAVGKEIYGVPAGIVDSNESPETAMIREIREETGCKAIKSKLISDLGFTSAGMTDESAMCYEVLVEKDGTQVLDNGELIENEYVKLEDIPQFIKEHEFDLPSNLQLRCFYFEKMYERTITAQEEKKRGEKRI